MNSLAKTVLTDLCDFSMRPFASFHQALLLRTWYRYIYSCGLDRIPISNGVSLLCFYFNCPGKWEVDG